MGLKNILGVCNSPRCNDSIALVEFSMTPSRAICRGPNKLYALHKQWPVALKCGLLFPPLYLESPSNANFLSVIPLETAVDGERKPQGFVATHARTSIPDT